MEDGGISPTPSRPRVWERVLSALTPRFVPPWQIPPGTRNLWQPIRRSMVYLPSPCGMRVISGKIALEAMKRAGPDGSSQKLRDALTTLKMDTVHGPEDFNKSRVTSYTAPIVKIDESYVPQIAAEYRVKADIVNGKFVYSIEK